MLTPIELAEPQLSSLLGRTSPLVKLGLALAWLAGLAAVREPGPAVALAVAALAAGFALGRLGLRGVAASLAPLLVVAGAIGLTTLLFATANGDPAVSAAAAIASRVLAIVCVGVVFAGTTESTTLVDALVQQGHLPARFAYGALAAYQAVPRLGEDLATLRSARRIRGLAVAWHPRILIGLLVRALRHADQLALAMDARAFGAGPRTTFRPLRWGWRDLVVGAGGLALLWIVALR